jgi:hypothetical protein
MAKDFVLNAMEWALHGCPARAPEDIKEIFETHCQPCEFFNEGRNIFGKVGFCEKCGCHVSADPDTLVNKIRDPLIGCPLDPPKFGPTIKIERKTK